MKKLIKMSAVALSIMTSTAAVSAELDIKVTNLTNGLYFTPIIIGAHSADATLFDVGMAASPELQMMAEGGDISGLSGILGTVSADINENPAGGLLAPGMSTETMMSTSDGNTVLSLASMILPTNDGFIGLDNWMIPEEAGTYTVYLNGYDAGTEANDEIVNGGGAPGSPGIPADPTGMGGTGAMGVTMTEATQVIHIHRGNMGDDDMAAGKSDLNNMVHRWLNPVAKVTVTVK